MHRNAQIWMAGAVIEIEQTSAPNEGGSGAFGLDQRPSLSVT
jgi:hypothetical protein